MLELAIVLLVVGVGALLLELLMPGWDGFIGGIVGIIALALSAVLVILGHPMGWLYAGIGAGALVFFGVMVYQFFTKKQLAGRIILSDTVAQDTSAIGDMSGLVGKEGTTVTLLRPQGEADFNGVRMEVISDGPMIERGAKIKITEAQPGRIVVAATLGN